MSSHTIHLIFSSLPSAPRSSLSSLHPPPLLVPGVSLCGVKDKRPSFASSDIRQRCNAISKPRTQEYSDLLQENGVSVINWHEDVEDDLEDEAPKFSTSNEISQRVATIKSMLGSMEDGEISVSAYDTAWVALVEDVNGSGTPQFPASLQWIANNQLPDGSWGDSEIFSAHDRILNTLACVIALKTWNMHLDKCEKGMSYFKDNLCKLEDEDAEHMPIGFEVAFPSLLEIARTLNIEVPADSPVLQEIYDRRNQKLTRIPKDIMHNVPTTLLHSLEGMPGLDWEKLLKLQCQDGSFLFSPSSTAFALAQTKDKNCLTYINNMVKKFNGGVPNVYPVDLFEHIWAVDRLERLGISRYFQQEIEECVNYVHRYWDAKGICWARNSEVRDIDDTAMGFRVLRSHGRQVSADVFKHFEKGGEFFCFAGQSSQAVTGMFNLYRASQVLFPGEKILEVAKEFSSTYLQEKQAANQLLDKWIIMKDLPGEVGFALDVPWYASLPRVETRLYIEQYGGENDVWIGKTLYRMPYVSSNEYLQVAKLDYNNCQTVHRMEWDNFQEWYEESNLRDFGISRRTLLQAYFLASANIFEPESSKERLAWAKTTVLLHAIESFFNGDNNSSEQRRTFVHEFKNGLSARGPVNGRTLEAKKTRQELVRTLLRTLNHISFDELVAYGRDISYSLRHAWEKWLLRWEAEGDRRLGEAELLVQTINLTAGHWGFEELSSPHPKYDQLLDLTNRLCYQLSHYQKHKVHENGSYTGSSSRSTSPEIESGMQELVELVLQKSSDGTDSNVKHIFLAVAKSFYYSAFCDPETINCHIDKVLFERVY